MKPRSVVLVAMALLLAPSAGAQEYPTKPIRVLVPYAPGGVVDTSTRIVTNKIMEKHGWQAAVASGAGQ